MIIVDIREAEANFLALIDYVVKGNEVIITQGGNPLVRMVIYLEKANKRKGGQLRGLAKINDNFDDALSEHFD